MMMNIWHPRSETLRLTADDYAMAMVTVEITDNDPQPIRLEVGFNRAESGEIREYGDNSEC